MHMQFDYRERADVFGSLMTELSIPHQQEELLDVMCCVNAVTFEGYLNDINIFINKSKTSNSMTISTVNEDRRWARYKVQLIWKRLKELANSRT